MVLENKKETLLKEKRMLNSMNKCNSDKRIRYGLMTLIDLADRYYSGGMDLMYIIKNNKFNLYILMHVMHEMKNAGIIDCRLDNPNWYFLKEEPNPNWILEMVPKLLTLFSSEEITQ